MREFLDEVNWKKENVPWQDACITLLGLKYKTSSKGNTAFIALCCLTDCQLISYFRLLLPCLPCKEGLYLQTMSQTSLSFVRPVIAPRKVNKTVRTSYSYVPKKVPIVMRKLYRSVFFECALVVCLQVDLCEDLRIPEAWARQWWVRTAEWELGIEPGSLQRGPNQ